MLFTMMVISQWGIAKRININIPIIRKREGSDNEQSLHHNVCRNMTQNSTNCFELNPPHYRHTHTQRMCLKRARMAAKKKNKIQGHSYLVLNSHEIYLPFFFGPYCILSAIIVTYYEESSSLSPLSSSSLLSSS